jgi:hypothetical protein
MCILYSKLSSENKLAWLASAMKMTCEMKMLKLISQQLMKNGMAKYNGMALAWHGVMARGESINNHQRHLAWRRNQRNNGVINGSA